jgi:hypothetical protein
MQTLIASLVDHLLLSGLMMWKLAWGRSVGEVPSARAARSGLLLFDCWPLSPLVPFVAEPCTPSDREGFADLVCREHMKPRSTQVARASVVSGRRPTRSCDRIRAGGIKAINNHFLRLLQREQDRNRERTMKKNRALRLTRVRSCSTSSYRRLTYTYHAPGTNLLEGMGPQGRASLSVGAPLCSLVVAAAFRTKSSGSAPVSHP